MTRRRVQTAPQLSNQLDDTLKQQSYTIDLKHSPHCTIFRCVRSVTNIWPLFNIHNKMMDNSIHSSTPVSLTEDECLTGPPPNNEDASSSGKNEEDLPDESLKSQSTPVAFDSEDGGGHSTLEHPNIPSNEHQPPSSSNTDLKGTSLKSTLYADDFIAEVDKHYNRVACSALCVWLTLVSISFYIGKRKNALKHLLESSRKLPWSHPCCSACLSFPHCCPYSFVRTSDA